MLNRVDYRFEPTAGAAGQANQVVTVDLNAILGFARRQMWLIGAFAALCFGLGIAYLWVTPPLFTASTNVLIDARRMELFRNESVFEEAGLNSSVVESELQVISSQKVADDVVRVLGLDEDPEFVGGSPSLVGMIVGPVKRFIAGLLAPKAEGGGGERDDATIAAETLRAAMNVRRIGMSYVIQVSFTSLDAEKAARVANAIAQAYIADQLEAKYKATERASGWLQARITELRDKASEADRAVQTFKADNSIISAGNNRLLGEAQVNELNTQLLTARNETAQAQARLTRLQEVNRSGIPDAAVADVLQSGIINRLRQDYLDLSKREREWAARYGEDHGATKNLRNQMTEIQRSIDLELARLEEIFKSNLEIAQSRQRSLEEALEAQVLRSGETMQAQVKLRELESAANSYRSLYDTFLQRYTQAVQQQSFPVTEARVITPATPPQLKSAPKGSVILPLSLAMGLCIGVAAAFAREFSERVVRTTRQLETIAETECLGILPTVEPPAKAKRAQREQMVAKAKADPKARLIRTDDFRQSAVLDEPFSRFAETIRAVKVAADINNIARRTQIIGVVSSIAQEGKSVVSANLARLIAQTGSRTILIDCDLRNPSLTRSLAPDARVGLAHVLLRQKELADAVYVDPLTGLHMLPVAMDVRIMHTNEILASEAMARFLDYCRGQYDYIVVDFPPILPVVDVRAAAHLPDAFVLVVEWRRTHIEIVRTAVASSPVIHQKLLGSVLNKVDVKTLSSFEPVRETYYRAGGA